MIECDDNASECGIQFLNELYWEVIQCILTPSMCVPHIEVYDCKNGFEKGLIELLRRGLEFIKPEKSIMYYGYDPFYDEEPDYLPMTLGQQIRVVYDSDDIVTEHLIDFFNSTRQETYEIIPASTFVVSPKTDKVFTLEDTYPERFFKWADDFIQYIR